VELVLSIVESRDLGEPHDFLDIDISTDLVAGTITISQESKASALARQPGVPASRIALPMSSDTSATLPFAMRDPTAAQPPVGTMPPRIQTCVAQVHWSHARRTKQGAS
jgi:hypothetical protein